MDSSCRGQDVNGTKVVLSFHGHPIERQAMILVFDRALVSTMALVLTSDSSARFSVGKGAKL